MARPEVLQALLASTDRVVQEVDSVEYGLTDIQVQLWAARDPPLPIVPPCMNSGSADSRVCFLTRRTWD